MTVVEIPNSIPLLSEKLNAWMDSIILGVPNFIVVILVALIGRKLIKLILPVVGKIVSKYFSSAVLHNLISNVITIALYAILCIIILSILGLNGPVTTLLASAGVAGLALGLALQDPLMNLFSGVIMSVKNNFELGDYIETNGFIGTVQNVSLKSTVLRLLSGEEVNIPNKLVLQSPVKNFSTNNIRRIDINCGISYADDLESAKEIAMKSVQSLTLTSVERPVEFIFKEFGESSIDFQLRLWTDSSTVWEFLNTKSEAIILLKKAFDANDITIPFPIRTLDYGIKGGKEIGVAMNEQGILKLNVDTVAASIK